QETVDAAAKAINDAVAALEEEKPAEPEKTELTITNNTGMFKAVTAYLTTEDGQEYLVMALSSSGYKELFKGTYEQAVANGDGTADKGNDTWVHSYTNEDGKLEFKIALGADETYVPCVAISNSYYTKYLNGTNALERAFYPRQFEVDREAKTLVTGDYDETADFAVTSNVADFKAAAAASTRVVGGPNSNNYNVAPTLAMEDTTYDKVTYPTVVSGKLSEESAELTDGKFAISLLNAPNTEAFQDKTPIKMTFHVAADAPYEEAGTDVERTVTIDKMAKTIVIDGTPLTEKAARLELAVDKTNAGMMKPAATAYLDGEKTVILPMENDSFSAIFVGDGSAVDEAAVIALAEDKTFTFEAPTFDEAFTVAFKSKKNGNWLNKKITVSKENATLVIVDDKADYTAVDAAIATIPEDLSDYTEESKAALEAAKAAVKTGKNSVEQAAVDEMAKAITDAVAGLKIDLANVEFPTFKVKTYSGIEKTPTFTPYYNGEKLVRDTDYTAEYSDNINVGEATIVVTGKGKYGGTATLHFTIAPKEITPKVTKSSSSLTWNGKNRSPKVSVFDGDTQLVKGQDYTIKMAANHSSVGKWTITVNLCGNYKGSAKTTFNIIPKGTDVTKVQSTSSKTFTVTWKKQATKMSTATITGYQIQWSTDPKFKTGNHTKMVAGYNTTSYTIDKSVWKGIEGGKKYYVRIRTYRKTSSGTYYSSWSDDVFTVTTKK
ncbi:MAG: fibronectin type III domain-containing protein, partial [Eubacterium sp.]|nr:fibronectin type III domain-containing protein [Eubacterium sp.]